MLAYDKDDLDRCGAGNPENDARGIVRDSYK